MISDIDIYRVAKLYVDEHGENAQIEAAKKFDEMTAKSDIAGRATWRRIGEAINALDRSIPNRPKM